MTTITKTELLKRFKDDRCRVYYKNQKDYVEYESFKHVNWKNVTKVTILFESKKIHTCDGEKVTRDGVAYLLDNK